jgi:hypothetical protein
MSTNEAANANDGDPRHVTGDMWATKPNHPRQLRASEAAVVSQRWPAAVRAPCRRATTPTTISARGRHEWTQACTNDGVHGGMNTCMYERVPVDVNKAGHKRGRVGANEGGWMRMRVACTRTRVTHE